MLISFSFQRIVRASDDLLHHTPEWRVNANRARKRDGESVANGANGGANGGFDNVALEDDGNSKL